MALRCNERPRPERQRRSMNVPNGFIWLHLDECGPGLFSETGIAKCSNCPLGTYSSGERNKACTKCPAGTVTVIVAAKGIQDCGSE